jgi:two-component system, cell cycle response regulator DivK
MFMADLLFTWWVPAAGLALAAAAGGILGYVAGRRRDAASKASAAPRQEPVAAVPATAARASADPRVPVLQPAPAAPPEQVEAHSLPSPRPGRGRSRGRAATILLADDQADLRAMNADYLRGHGYSVLTAGDGDTALALARTHRPAVIVLDHTMPGRTGVEVARELGRDAALGGVPILLLTAHSYGAVGGSARAAGCVGYLAKPCSPRRLLTEIARFAPPPDAPRH